MLFKGCPVTEYFTAPQREDPYRVAGDTPEEVLSAKDAMDAESND
jgi:hypothetical protein